MRETTEECARCGQEFSGSVLSCFGEGVYYCQRCCDRMEEEEAAEPHLCTVCGEELEWQDCPHCEDGYCGHDCGDDTCCCLDPEPNVPCDYCNGQGGFLECPRVPHQSSGQ